MSNDAGHFPIGLKLLVAAIKLHVAYDQSITIICLTFLCSPISI